MLGRSGGSGGNKAGRKSRAKSCCEERAKMTFKCRPCYPSQLFVIVMPKGEKRIRQVGRNLLINEKVGFHKT